MPGRAPTGGVEVGCGDPTCLPVLHDALRTFLAGCREEVGIDVELVAVELATNALEHAAAPRSVHVAWTADDRVLVAVVDGSPDAALTPGRSRLGTRRGRGLAVVDAVATWGVDRGDTTKTVWATLPAA